jgi:lipoic acid synthetase
MGDPPAADPDEPQRIADAVSSMGLSYAVVTSVTRDDLPDGGAEMFADTIRAIRRRTPDCRVEVLIPDFQGSAEALGTVFSASPYVLNHNIETVPSLYPRVRPQADYGRSLQVLARAAERGFLTKSGLMLGLGEDRDEVRKVMADLRDVGCDLLTIGQYLQPRKDLLPVERFYLPDEFLMLEQEGRELGFRAVQAGPRVRSSYHAASTGVHGGQVPS